ncbi:MAG: hypothetical protein ACYDH6_13685 [Acidimicrobiales bacterium]
MRADGDTDPRKALPTTTSAAPSTTTTTTTIIPRAVRVLAPGAVPGEGQWIPAGQRVGDRIPLFVTTLRPPSGGVPVGVARLDTWLTRVVVYAGTSQPGGTWSAEGSVPPSQQADMVASFNGGFQFGSAGGGFYADGRAQPPLRDGAASLVVHRDGTAEVAQWGRDAALTPDVLQVRQNLSLLVDAGQPSPLASSWGAWGATLSHGAATWRSAVGSDNRHHLYFVGGPNLTPSGLASVLVAVGAQRAMELDINPQWVFFAHYTGGLPPIGTKLLASMNYAPAHVLNPSWRDFVAVFTRHPW